MARTHNVEHKKRLSLYSTSNHLQVWQEFRAPLQIFKKRVITLEATCFMHNYQAQKGGRWSGGKQATNSPKSDPWARDKNYIKSERKDDKYFWQKPCHLSQIRHKVDSFLSIYIYILTWGRFPTSKWILALSVTYNHTMANKSRANQC